MNSLIDTRDLQSAYDRAAAALLDEATPSGHWVGELSTSALSTATAVMALELVRRDRPERAAELAALIAGGTRWLMEHQNADGGWGDTVLSFSNISTTMLAHASLITIDRTKFQAAIEKAQVYIDAAGGIDGLKKRYGKDKTFSVPILTHCALAGVVPWSEVSALPFELGCLPHRFYKWIRLPVVSYALPALIAIGQVVHHKRPSRNPAIRALRERATAPTLKLLTSIQPTSGGFLEAAPLTSFVTMSLAGMGQSRHPVAESGVRFLMDSVRADGSWPIDTNLATWGTTLAVNALQSESLPAEQAAMILDWLLGQQYRAVHPYTQAAPGGWAWTDLSGGVPDADDTPGAMLAVMKLAKRLSPLDAAKRAAIQGSLEAAAGWLLDLQNGDGGWPTFCRGWGALPFDRSSNDLTAHAIRALHAWRKSEPITQSQQHRVSGGIQNGLRYLSRSQSSDGGWRPLWFGNQHAPDDENPVYGTSRVLMMFRDLGRLADPAPQRAIVWLASVQNTDGGWGGASGCPSSIEETALATEALLAAAGDYDATISRGVDYLVRAVDDNSFRQPSPIGFYFAKLWYFERLYPMIFTTSALAAGLKRACHGSVSRGTSMNR
jgi:squalene-hopene/tetraprenyl-beta-curcumene cyclase